MSGTLIVHTPTKAYAFNLDEYTGTDNNGDMYFDCEGKEYIVFTDRGAEILQALGDGKNISIDAAVHTGVLKRKDAINPDHYKLDLPCESIDYQLAVCKRLPGNEGALAYNVLKYVTRYKLKNGLEDLKKAKWYLDKLISEVSE